MPLPKENLYTFADLMTWDENERYELIEGVPFLMAPAPADVHQRISMELSIQIGGYLRDKSCRAYAAPFDVRLFEKREDTPKKINTVVQPDFMVICDPNKIDKHGCKGAPDMVVEILSPSTHRHDRLTKFNLYAKAGVKEYWIVDPKYKSVEVFLLENGQYMIQTLGTPSDQLKVNVLDDCYVDLSKVFPE